VTWDWAVGMIRIPRYVPYDIGMAVIRRSGGYCEACEARLIMDSLTEGAAFHHRLPRSAGGGESLINLMLVHHSCHNVAPGSIHQNPARSYRMGHLVHRGSDPADMPILTAPGLREMRA